MTRRRRINRRTPPPILGYSEDVGPSTEYEIVAALDYEIAFFGEGIEF